ncbi:phage baseplate assembly protein V [Roseomonas terrae]|uniref:Phage baseplate assembly protein V n=1 Tax=Neoroseomonas terrae TaxID=424799 RepID=A0ABS5EQK5_9PROT|nr:phage baseplate assembly protein V [Neoroseomonas terrae]MBR0653303.1 phage baseplate assembly protein V [Neoroseomonas terrae]
MVDLNRTLGPVYRRIMLMVGRGVLSRTDDGRGTQRMQVTLLDGETRDAADRIQPYGLTSHAPAGSHVVVLNVGGQRDHPIIIGADNPDARPTNLAAGEVMVWSGHGQRVHLREDGGLVITTTEGHRLEMKPGGDAEIECQALTIKAATKVRMETPLVELTGAVASAEGMAGLTVQTPALNVTGEVQDRAGAGGMTMHGMRADYNAHHHGGAGPTPPMAP